MSEASKLLPCPFCGGTDIEFTSGEDSDLWAYCEDCHAGISGNESNPTPDGETEDVNGLNEADREQCREAWNHRPTTAPTATGAREARLEKALKDAIKAANCLMDGKFLNGEKISDTGAFACAMGSEIEAALNTEEEFTREERKQARALTEGFKATLADGGRG